MKRVPILVEGQTEEQFIKTVLAPYLWQYQVTMIPTVITGPMGSAATIQDFQEAGTGLSPVSG